VPLVSSSTWAPNLRQRWSALQSRCWRLFSCPSPDRLLTDADGTPLAGAIVAVEEPPLETATDVDGRFRLAGQPGRTYRLRARAEG